jgi:hypothetical protein
VQLVGQYSSIVANDPAADTPVVILVLDALAPAVVHRFPGDDDLVVVIFVVVSPDQAAAGCLLTDEAAVVVHAAPPSVTKMTLGNAADADTNTQLRGFWDSKVPASPGDAGG